MRFAKVQTRAREPVREQLRAILIAEIERGAFLHGSKLPAERELAQTFGTSRTTVRQAIESLIGDGLLTRAAGKGTFVAAPRAGGRQAKAPRDTTARDAATFGFAISEYIYQYVPAGYNRMLLDVQRACQENGCRLLFHFVTDDAPDPSGPVDGYIVTGGVPRRVLDRWSAAGTPFVLVDLLLDDRSASIGFDYAGGMRQAMTYLHELGHREIGFIGFPNSEKYVAYWQSLAAFGIRYEPQAVVFLGYPDLQPSMLAGYRAMQALLAASRLPTAVIATNDLVAQGAMDALAMAGVGVPDRMSVIGFDDLEPDVNRPLTTIRAESAEVGRLAVGALLDQLRHGVEAQKRITVPMELVIRASAAPPPVAAGAVPAGGGQ